LDFPERVVWAELALPYAHQLVEGDLVLAIGQHERWYVIGVLASRGLTTIMVPADLSIKAPRGSIHLSAANGVHLSAARVKIKADKLDLAARRMTERFQEATRWIKGLFHIRAHRLCASVESDYRLNAGRIAEHAAAEVKINGQQIHLG